MEVGRARTGASRRKTDPDIRSGPGAELGDCDNTLYTSLSVMLIGVSDDKSSSRSGAGAEFGGVGGEEKKYGV